MDRIEVVLKNDNKVYIEKDIINQFGKVDMENLDTLQLTNVDSESFNYIINFLKKNTEQEKKFIINNLKHEDLINVTYISDLLGVPEITDLCRRRFKVLIRNNSPDTIRSELDIKNCFTEDEKTNMKKYYKWTTIKGTN